MPDLAVGLPEVGSGKLRKAGEVRVFSGKKGTLLFRLPGRQREEEYADAMAAIGDIDGDGATDLAVGASWADPMARVDIVSGKTGKVLRSIEKPGPVGFGSDVCAVGDGSGKAPVNIVVRERMPKAWLCVDPKSGENVGSADGPAEATSSATWVGDVDGDGRPDVAFADWSEDAGKVGKAGRIRVMSGAGLCGAKEEDLLVLRGQKEMESLGLVLARAGDWDGDGKGDLFAGTSGGADPKGGWSVRVLSGKDGSELWKATGEKGDYAIGGVALAGDVDGDGKADVAVGAPGRKGKAGEVFVLSGKDGKVLWTVPGSGSGEKLGEEVLAIPDADGDGFPDLCVTAPGKAAGYVRFLSGKTGKAITSFNPLN